MTGRANMKLDDSLRLNRAEKKFRMLFENSPLGMAMINHKTGDFLEVNQSLLDFTGYSKEEFLQLSFWDITPREYEVQEASQIEDLNTTGKFGPNEKEYIRKDGTRFPIRLSGFKLIDVDGVEVVWGLIEDISERKKLEDDLLHMATHDPLTTLANRRLFAERLALTHDFCHREHEKFAVLVLDLDEFKSINDCCGHYVGDEVLKAFAKRLLSVVHRKTDTVARTGGDEFTILLSPINHVDDVLSVAQAIQLVMKQPFEIGDHILPITVSIGGAIYPDTNIQPERLVMSADDATYQVKENGGNAIIVHTD